MKILIDLIESIEDPEYKQTLYTIEFCIPESDHSKFYEMLKDAQKNEKEIYIDDSSLKDISWDSFDFEIVKIK